MYLIFQLHYIFGNPYVYFRDIWGYKYINFTYGIFVCAYISSHWVAPFETKMTYLKNVFNIYENKDVHWGLGHRLAGTANNFHRVGKDPKIKVFFYILGSNQVEKLPPPIPHPVLPWKLMMGIDPTLPPVLSALVVKPLWAKKPN